MIFAHCLQYGLLSFVLICPRSLDCCPRCPREEPLEQSQRCTSDSQNKTAKAQGESAPKGDKPEKKTAATNVAASSAAANKATVWGSPLKSYSWADDDAPELAAEKSKPEPKKEEVKKEAPKEKKPKEDKKSKEEHKKPKEEHKKPEEKPKAEGEHQLKSKFSRSADKIAKIPHVTSVKVSPPPNSKFSVLLLPKI